MSPFRFSRRATAAVVALSVAACVSPGDLDIDGPAETGAATVEVVEALRQAGAQVAQVGEVRQPFLSAPGLVLDVDGRTLWLHVYPGPEAASRDVARFSRDASTVGTTQITWVAQPHVYRSGASIVIYVGEDAAMLALLTRVLGPQVAGR